MTRHTGATMARPTNAKFHVGVSRATIYRWAKKGHIKLYKRFSMTFFDVAEVQDFIKGLGGQLGGHSQ
jgi:hypothetical protein